MYRRVPCDWFICDGVFRRVRLDSPMLIGEALTDCGVIAKGESFTDRLASEWIYRRSWTYSADFSMDDGENARTFIKLTGLKGRRSVTLNGKTLECGEASCEEFEVTGLLKGDNRIEIAFEPDTSFEIAPKAGFGGMLMFRKTLQAAIISAAMDEVGNISIETDCAKPVTVTVKYTRSCGESEESEASRQLSAGRAVISENPFGKAQPGARTDVTVQLYIKKQLSDEASRCLYVPAQAAVRRGFVTDSAALMGLSASAHANCVFTEKGADEAAAGVLAARHSLACVPLEDTPAREAPPALMPEDRLYEIAGRPEALKDRAVWILTGSSKECYDAAAALAPSGELESLIRVSRYSQAVSLAQAALTARAEKKPFALCGIDKGLDAPGSCALIDGERHVRPAFCALMNAWRPFCGFTRVTQGISADGIFSADVYALADAADTKAMALRVAAYDTHGTLLNSSSYAVLGDMAYVGRFVSELPEDGISIIRTVITAPDGTKYESDELVMRGDMSLEDLPETQILVTGSSVKNAGKNAAVGLCVKEAGFFGCLMPGDDIAADRADNVEGLNIYF